MGLKKNLENYAEWVEGLTTYDHSNLQTFWIEALSQGRFGPVYEPVSVPFKYHLNKQVFEFGPVLADPECYGQPKRIESFEAFQFMFYRKVCKSEGVTPGPFVDFRYYVRRDLDSDEYAVEVIQARDCQ